MKWQVINMFSICILVILINGVQLSHVWTVFVYCIICNNWFNNKELIRVSKFIWHCILMPWLQVTHKIKLFLYSNYNIFTVSITFTMCFSPQKYVKFTGLVEFIYRLMNVYFTRWISEIHNDIGGVRSRHRNGLRFRKLLKRRRERFI